MIKSSSIAESYELFPRVSPSHFDPSKNSPLQFNDRTGILELSAKNDAAKKGGPMNSMKELFGSSMAKILKTVLLLTIVLFQHFAFAQKKKTIRKVQEVNFAEMNLKGTFRNPDGAYLVQKRGIKFLPLYEVNKDMDARIRDSSFYVK